MDTSNLSGRTVLVTGAGSGIGRETALLAARRGADLVICDVDEAGLATTEASARGSGRSVLARRVDVADRDQMGDFAEAVHGQTAAVDVLVNNAGVGLAAGLLDTELADWDWIVSINLMGVVHGCHFFVPKMVARGAGGHVANVSSMAGFHASPALLAYTTTKFAVLGLSEALREELQPHGIGVSAICPGMINTPITTSARARGAADDPAVRERVVAMYRRRNYGPERVARNIFKAVERNRSVAPIAPEAWVAYAMKRVSPRLAGWTARRLASLTE
jgi:NAD(P)-dependent dehydrogenase (short-subunit alcohol dehydrogenase family)